MHNSKVTTCKPILDYPNYVIYSDGRVYSLKRNRFMSPWLNSNGYYKVNLWKSGKPKSCRVHRLVASAFIPNPHNKPQVDHKDRNRLNNNIDNLRWETSSVNNRNQSLSKANTSGYQGVSLHKNRNTWCARWCDQNGKLRSKSFKKIEDAIAYRAERVKELYQRPINQ